MAEIFEEAFNAVSDGDKAVVNNGLYYIRREIEINARLREKNTAHPDREICHNLILVNLKTLFDSLNIPLGVCPESVDKTTQTRIKKCIAIKSDLKRLQELIDEDDRYILTLLALRDIARYFEISMEDLLKEKLVDQYNVPYEDGI